MPSLRPAAVGGLHTPHRPTRPETTAASSFIGRSRCLAKWGLGSKGTVNRLKRSEVSPSRFAEFERELKLDIWLGVNVPTYYLDGTAWDASEVTGNPNA